MYRRSPPLFQPSFRIMLNNGTNASVSAERDHVQITMIRRYHREPPTRTPCSLVSAPICMNSCFRALSFLLFTVVNNSIPPPPPLPLLLFLLFESRKRLFIYSLHIHIETSYTSYNLNNCFSMEMCQISFFLLFTQHDAREKSSRRFEKRGDK